METFDTNVLVRLLVEDDPQQSAAALRCWRQAMAGDGVFLPKLILAETIWVLGRAYRFERTAILDVVGALLHSHGLKVEDEQQVSAALAAFGEGAADFSDYLILEDARANQALPVKTFDRRLARHADAVLIEVASSP
jgi:predicted nucleic-acid-binding protein